MSNFKIIGRSRQYICFKHGHVVFTKTPKRNMTTPGLSAKCLYKCYQQINLKPGRQNFMYETSLREPARAAISYDNESYEKPVQKGEGNKVQNEPQIEIKSESVEESKGVQKSNDSNLTIQNILKKFKHPIYDTKTEVKKKRPQTETKSEPKAKKQKLQSGGNEVFRFY